MYYDRTYRVKKWIITGELTEKQQELLLKAMPKTNTAVVPWPALEMKDELKKLGSEGYWEYINQPMPYFLDIVLALRAMVNITRRHRTNAQISPAPAYHRLVNNRVSSDADFERIGNEILSENDDITLSQVFDTRDHQNEIWLSINGDKDVVTKIADRVITIGNGSQYDVDLTNLNIKDTQTALSAAYRD